MAWRPQNKADSLQHEKQYTQVYSSTHRYIVVHTSMYWYVLVCTCMDSCIQYIPLIGASVARDTGFHGLHRDAAMPPPSADHARMEDGDPHPCPEDAEFFECRPDTVDMEEAIALDVWAQQAQPGWSLSGGDCSQEKC